MILSGEPVVGVKPIAAASNASRASPIVKTLWTNERGSRRKTMHATAKVATTAMAESMFEKFMVLQWAARPLSESPDFKSEKHKAWDIEYKSTGMMEPTFSQKADIDVVRKQGDRYDPDAIF